MASFLKIIRLPNLLMVLLTMVLTRYALIIPIVNPAFLTHFQFILLSISILSITAGGYIVNDIFDIEADQLNKPHKAFIPKLISLKTAWNSYFSLNFLGIITGSYLAVTTQKQVLISVFFFTVIGLFLYSKYLKKIAFLGNIFIAILVALTLLITYAFHSHYSIKGIGNSLLLYYVINCYVIFSFLTTLIREIIKDIEDIKGDYKLKMKTLPIILGRKTATHIAFFITLILLVLLITSVKLFLIHRPILLFYSFIFIIIPLLYFMYKLLYAKTKKDYHTLSQYMKLIMLFGIISMLLFLI